MRTYSAEQIYGFALSAGFTPDAAATMTAIALAESSGNTGARNSSGEDSRGLWQINAAAHPELARRYDLYDPVHNARAAFEVSGGGADVSPWTVTHGGSSAPYLRFREEAQDAAVAAGNPPGLGVWTGTLGYGHPLAPGGGGGGSPALLQAATGDNAALDRFLEVARNQIGDRYVFGSEADLDDADPDVFDCSEFTQWAADQAGVTLPDGATHQYLHLKKLGVLVPVEEAKNIPGALLFSFDREPRLGDGRTPGAHVAISLGDGATVEARNSRDGVGQFTAGDRFQYAAVIPGISDGEATVPPPAVPPPVEPQPLLGGPDSDQDGLSDAYERQAGFDPANRDTDRDNLPDGYEAVVLKTNPLLADSDADGLSDAFEIPSGLDPTSPDTDRDGHLDGTFAADWRDDDRDGLDNKLEQVIGFDPTRPDSDNDGIADKLEAQSGTDPADVRPGDPLGPAGQLGADPYDTPVT
jgi:cell wall-associated NlpC family hydrolase